ncbi:MAG: response regulator [Bryobacterales bacterium]|nr:response regulator [Bryobacterales bacterium]
MAAISTLIADDEELAREELSYLLREYRDVEILGFAANGIEALKLIEDFEPDLVFLDVQMPGFDGLNVIRRLREKEIPAPAVILTTAFEQYAVEAFREEAFDYLLKPIEKERLDITMERARRQLAEKAKLQPTDPTEIAPRSAAPRNAKLMVKAHNRNFIVDEQEIIFATINDGLITVVCSNVEGTCNFRTLEELQSSLDLDLFWRVHRSYLVNINHIREVIPWFKSSYQLRMDDKGQAVVPVSRVQTKRLRSMLKL